MWKYPLRVNSKRKSTNHRRIMKVILKTGFNCHKPFMLNKDKVQLTIGLLKSHKDEKEVSFSSRGLSLKATRVQTHSLMVEPRLKPPLALYEKTA
ncbi:CLUMA_CG010107, isoform A [Clunio marinus]|uniref:CLUMA_CG010107, isoform A n=1 Tax=Clunio marinus TaxID=568069 RepID=A0A1J1I9C4_9DIPT|nr:CLUMA_CG010107, isoform A [Clunio marinus]